MIVHDKRLDRVYGDRKKAIRLLYELEVVLEFQKDPFPQNTRVKTIKSVYITRETLGEDPTRCSDTIEGLLMIDQLRVCAVSYLNTVPLVWDFTHGPRKGLYDLRFAVPGVCADELRTGGADVGLVPVIELANQPDLLVLPGISIASREWVRSVLLFSRKPMEAIESVAADTSSRTSIALTQVLMAHSYGTRPRIQPYPPRLDEMLELADAGLIIGDPALRLGSDRTDWKGQPLFVYDLGNEWWKMTGLPMVFAVWAVKNLVADPALPQIFQESVLYGQKHMDEIVASESIRRNFAPDLIRRYLTQNTSFGLGNLEQRSLSEFLTAASDLGLVDMQYEVTYMDEPAVAETE